MHDQAQRLRSMVAKQSRSSVEDTRIITITSGKGGVGKSNFVLNYAIGLSESGSKVVVIDADVGFANIDVLMNVKPTKTLADLMRGEATIWEVLERGPQNVEYIAGGSGLQELLNIDADRYDYVIEQLGALQGYADYVLIDTGAGLNEQSLRLLLASDQIYVILTPEPTSITDAYALIKMVTNRDNSVSMQLVVNRAQTPIEGKEAADKISLVAERFLDLKLSTLCILPDDPSVAKSVKQQMPFLLAHPNSEISRSLKSMIQAQKNGEVQQVHQTRGMKQFLHRMVRLFR